MNFIDPVDSDDEDATVDVHERDYEGEMTVETAGSTEDLLGRLQQREEAGDN